MLKRLLLLGGPIILCGRDFWIASGEMLVVYMLCGRVVRTPSGVAGGETAMETRVEVVDVDETALGRDRAQSFPGR